MPRQITLQVHAPGGQSETRTIDRSDILIGRAGGGEGATGPGQARVDVDDGSLEPTHARIFLLPDRAWVADSWSQSGTKLDGRKLTIAQPLSPGATLSLGRTRIVVEGIDLDAAVKPDAATARYASFVIDDTCDGCGARGPVDGPTRMRLCRSCGQMSRISVGDWKAVLESGNTSSGGAHVEMNSGMHADWSVERPACIQCRQPLPVDDVPADGDEDVFCPACGTPNPSRPAPGWLAKALPSVTRTFGADEETTVGDAMAGGAREAVAVQHDPSRPAALTCPNCNAALEMPDGWQRTVTCAYCSTNVMIPVAVLGGAFPSAPPRTWWVRYDGPSKEQSKADGRIVSKFNDFKKRQQKVPVPTARKNKTLVIAAIVVLTVVTNVPVLVALWWFGLFSQRWEQVPLQTVEAEAGGVPFTIDVPEGFEETSTRSTVEWKGKAGMTRVAIMVGARDTWPETSDAAREQGLGSIQPRWVREEDDGWSLLYEHPDDHWMTSVVLHEVVGDDETRALRCEAQIGGAETALERTDDAAAWVQEICGSLEVE